MDDVDLGILIIPLVACVAPLLATLVRRAVMVPLVVFEIALGMLVGPDGLGWVSETAFMTTLSQLGLAMLFFMAGNEIDPTALRGRTGRRSIAGWALSAALAVAAAAVLGDGVASAAIIAIALTGTALGTIMPALRDSGIARTPLGATIGAAGAIGEFLPLVAVSVLLSGRQPVVGVIVLCLFVAIAASAFWIASRGPHQWLRRMVSATLHTSGQFGVRFVVLLVAALVCLALALGVDFLLGAFTAGMLARVVLQDGDPEELRVIEAKLDSIAFGFFVPVFFVTTGISFPLARLLADPATLVLVPVFAGVMLLVRGIPGLLVPAPGTTLSDRRTAALFTATTLPLVIAVTQIGADQGLLEESTAAAMVGGAMLTVLFFPLLALLGRHDEAPAATTDADAPFPFEAHE
ncbi:cation:proton antiporter [Microbacterium sp.]|uniref:cation:proton antiporter n=1 Tax=Microbacterium sp. TaxID=51671 RepID=UPI0039E4979F